MSYTSAFWAALILGKLYFMSGQSFGGWAFNTLAIAILVRNIADYVRSKKDGN